MKLEVDSYCGYKGDERPVRFRLDGQECVVEELLAQWYAPDGACFKVRTRTGDVYVLLCRIAAQEEAWSLEPPRRR